MKEWTNSKIVIELEGVESDSEGSLELCFHPSDPNPTWELVAYNEGGFNHTRVDVLSFLKWIRENKPELLEAA